MGKIIEFDSVEEYFYYEKRGSKNNTLRKINLLDERFQRLLRAWKLEQYPLIRINKKGFVITSDDRAHRGFEDKADSFLRQISNISIYKDQMIITWEVEG